jgi:hypothetical protein
MYIMDSETVQQDIKAADEDYSNTIERLIARHAKLRNKRPGGEREEDTG